MIFLSVKFLHLASLVFLFCASIFKNITVSRRPFTESEVYRCKLADKVSGAAAGLMVLSGFGLLYVSPKGAPYYFGHILFWVKMALLVIATLLILRTKVFFRKHGIQKSTKIVSAPGFLIPTLRFDAISLLAMVLLAVLFANGIGWQI